VSYTSSSFQPVRYVFTRRHRFIATGPVLSCTNAPLLRRVVWIYIIRCNLCRPSSPLQSSENAASDEISFLFYTSPHDNDLSTASLHFMHFMLVTNMATSESSMVFIFFRKNHRCWQDNYKNSVVSFFVSYTSRSIENMSLYSKSIINI